MKGKIALFLCVVILLLTCGCNEKRNDRNEGYASGGIWVSYSEINTMLDSAEGFEAELEKVAANCERLGIENVYLHVRPFCDSLYKSDYFPLMRRAENYEYDLLEKAVEVFHDSDIKLHAWINPYRVQTSSADISKLSPKSPAYLWLTDDDVENDINVCFFDGIYLNPAESDVRELVINGIKEILKNYDVDGIHIDDYFYPTISEDFDRVSYENYKRETEIPLSLADWRRSNVNGLVSGIYSAVKSSGKSKNFSVSPAASIERNYNSYYADVEEWIENGYVDTVIPQLYFGFEYVDDNFKFENILNRWKEVCNKNLEVELLIGLGAYKIATRSEADGDEWCENFDIISRQAEICYNDSRVGGYVIFSYFSLFSAKEENTLSKENLLEFLNKTQEGKKYG